MKIVKPAVCGTLESGDIQITVRPNDGSGIEIGLNSVVQIIFGEAILGTVRQVLKEWEVADIHVELVDKGALDCTIRARMQTVLLRASGEKYDWTREDKR